MLDQQRCIPLPPKERSTLPTLYSLVRLGHGHGLVEALSLVPRRQVAPRRRLQVVVGVARRGQVAIRRVMPKMGRACSPPTRRRRRPAILWLPVAPHVASLAATRPKVGSSRHRVLKVSRDV